MMACLSCEHERIKLYGSYKGARWVVSSFPTWEAWRSFMALARRNEIAYVIHRCEA